MANEWTLVTGASEGIGKEIARVAAAKGRNVILSARSADKLNALADELKSAYGVDAATVVADLAEPEGPAKLWAEATADGRKIDFLVNNAGLGRHGPFGDDTHGGWEREATSIQVNVVALTELMKLAVPHMKTVDRGRILNVASIAGFMAGPNMAVYHATKAYVVSLTRAVQAELEDTDITVTALCPGATKSDFFADAEMQSARVTRMGGGPASAASVAEEGYDAAMRGQTTIVPGATNIMMTLAAKFLPAMATTAFAKYSLAKQ